MRTERGEEIVDDSFLLLFNAHSEPVEFTLPTRRFGLRWRGRAGDRRGAPLGTRSSRPRAVRVQEHSLTLLRRVS